MIFSFSFEATRSNYHNIENNLGRNKETVETLSFPFMGIAAFSLDYIPSVKLLIGADRSCAMKIPPAHIAVTIN